MLFFVLGFSDNFEKLANMAIVLGFLLTNAVRLK